MAERAALLGVAGAAIRSNVPRPPGGNAATQQTPAEQYTGVCGCCRWFISDGGFCSAKKLNFMGWIVIVILSIVFYFIYIGDEAQAETFNIGYILCCSLAILMSLYATYNFRSVVALRQAVSALCNQTKELAEQRDKIRNEVGRLQTAHVKLESIDRKLAESNGELRKNFAKFQDWNTVIQKNVKSNSENAGQINKDFKQAIDQYRKLLVQNEKAILDKAYRSIENRDGQKGLSRDEFHDLIAMLPARYKTRFEELGKSFEDFAGDDNNIDHEEFATFMYVMAEQVAVGNVNLPQFGITQAGGAGKRQYDDDGKDDEKDS